MSEHSADEVNKHVKIYQMIFGALLVLTVVTWWAAYLPFPFALGVAVALAIATVKAGLVASFFMHLAYEKRIIFAVLLITGVFFVAMMVIILGSAMDTVHYDL